MFRIDDEFIERLKDEGYDLWIISQWEQWLGLQPELEGAVDCLRIAFRDVKLGDGVGIYEANGRDDYAGDAEILRLRGLD